VSRFPDFWKLRNIGGGAGVSQSVYRLSYGLGDRDSILGGGNWLNFFLRKRIHTGSVVNPASNPMGSGGSYPRVKAAGTRSWLLTSIYCRG